MVGTDPYVTYPNMPKFEMIKKELKKFYKLKAHSTLKLFNVDEC